MRNILIVFNSSGLTFSFPVIPLTSFLMVYIRPTAQTSISGVRIILEFGRKVQRTPLTIDH